MGQTHDSVTITLGSEHEGWPYLITCSCGVGVPLLAITGDVVPTFWATHRAVHDAPIGPACGRRPRGPR